MSYHSDTLAFKKSELLAVLQAIDEDFTFDTASLCKPKILEAISPNQQDSNSYKKLLFKKPLLTIYESACIMSNTELYLVLACMDEYDSKITYPNWGGALDYINTCVKEGFLNIKDSTRGYIKRDDLKKFLASEDIIISGFNDNLPAQESIECGQPSIQQIESNVENLNAEIIKLTELIVEKDAEIDKLKKDFEKENLNCFDLFLDKVGLEKEIANLKDKIKDLESDQSKKIDLLDLIFDETSQDRYAPDLALSIRLWEDLYIKNPKADSHSNRANKWIDANTEYGDTSKSKLREITTPFINWSTHRDKNFKK